MNPLSKNSKSENIIFNLLSIDIKSFQAYEFEFIGIEKNDEDTEFKRYRKTLYNMELGLFKTLEIIVFSENEASYFFHANSKEINFNELENLIKKFIDNYGPDSFGYGQFLKEEITDIQSGTFWKGRMWMDLEPEIMFTLKESGIIELGVLGVDINM
jgi:hypothetical protein